MFGQLSLAGNRVAALHLATRVFLAENHISDNRSLLVISNRKRAGKSTREVATKFEKFKAKKTSREAEEGQNEKISMKNIVKLKEIERETKHLFTTVSFQVMFSFLTHASLPHIFCKLRQKTKKASKRLQFRIDRHQRSNQLCLG